MFDVICKHIRSQRSTERLKAWADLPSDDWSNMRRAAARSSQPLEHVEAVGGKFDESLPGEFPEASGIVAEPRE